MRQLHTLTPAAPIRPLAQVFDSPPDVAAVKPYVVAMQHVLRCACARGRT